MLIGTSKVVSTYLVDVVLKLEQEYFSTHHKYMSAEEKATALLQTRNVPHAFTAKLTTMMGLTCRRACTGQCSCGFGFYTLTGYQGPKGAGPNAGRSSGRFLSKIVEVKGTSRVLCFSLLVRPGIGIKNFCGLSAHHNEIREYQRKVMLQHPQFLRQVRGIPSYSHLRPSRHVAAETLVQKELRRKYQRIVFHLTCDANARDTPTQTDLSRSKQDWWTLQRYLGDFFVSLRERKMAAAVAAKACKGKVAVHRTELQRIERFVSIDWFLINPLCYFYLYFFFCCNSYFLFFLLLLFVVVFGLGVLSCCLFVLMFVLLCFLGGRLFVVYSSGWLFFWLFVPLFFCY